MLETVGTYCEILKKDVFDLMPVTFPLDQESQTCVSEFAKFVQYFGQIDKSGADLAAINVACSKMLLPVTMRQTDKLRYQSANYELREPFSASHNVWILKAANFNRGVGIHVFSTLHELHTLLKEYADMLGPNRVSYQLLKCIQSL